MRNWCSAVAVALDWCLKLRILCGYLVMSGGGKHWNTWEWKTYLAVHTDTFTQQAAKSCSANVVLQDAVISAEAVDHVKTLRSEISIAGWDLTVQRGREQERMGERWRCVKTKQSVRFQCYSLVMAQPWLNSSKSFSLHSGDVVAGANQTVKSSLSVDVKGRTKQQGYWITINIFSLLSLSVPPRSDQ